MNYLLALMALLLTGCAPGLYRVCYVSNVVGHEKKECHKEELSKRQAKAEAHDRNNDPRLGYRHWIERVR